MKSMPLGIWPNKRREANDRARIESAYRTAQEWLALMMDAAGGVGAWDWDVPNDRVCCNEALATLLSVDPSRARAGVPIAEFLSSVHADDRDAVIGQMRDCTRTAGEYTREYRVVNKDGGVTWVRARGRCHLDEKGAPMRFPGVVLDVTQGHNDESRLSQTAKLECLGLLSGGIAHDFNNLLTGIVANASLLEVDVRDEHRPLVQDILSASQRAADLARQMLMYAGRACFKDSQFDLSKLVRDLLPLLKPSLGNATLKLHLPDNLPPVHGDPAQFQSIVMNLAVNASEAIARQGGTIMISTGVADTADIADMKRAWSEQDAVAGSLEPGPHVWLEIRDNGAAMSREDLANIFEPFFTAKPVHRCRGLSAICGLVRAHRGAIRVRSEPGQGSTFTIFFPVSATVKSQASPAVRQPDGRTAILFVDDEDTVRRIGRNILARNGYNVRLAGSGQEAVDILRESPHDISLVVLDMMMPGMSGDEAFRRLRQIKPDIPVLISSGYDESEVVCRFRAGDISGFLQKPYTAAQFLEKINEVLESAPESV